MGLQSLVDRATASLSNSNPNAAIDIGSIGMIFEIIRGILDMFQGCGRDAANVTAIAKKPTRLQKRFVKNRTRKELGRRAYRTQGPDMVQAVLDAGKGTSVEEMQAALDDID